MVGKTILVQRKACCHVANVFISKLEVIWPISSRNISKMPQSYRCQRVKHRFDLHSPLQKRESTGASFSYRFDWKSKHFIWNLDEWKATQPSLRVFSENCPNRSLSKVAKFHTNPYNFVACLPKPYKLSILGDIRRATILPFCHFPPPNTSIRGKYSQT